MSLKGVSWDLLKERTGIDIIKARQQKEKASHESVLTGPNHEKMRFKMEYLLRLIACYREHYKKGKMLPDSLAILIDAAKRTLDNDSDQIDDWHYLKHGFEGTWSIRILSWSRRNLCFIRPVKWLFF